MRDEERTSGIPRTDSLQLTAGDLYGPVGRLPNRDTVEIGDHSVASLSGGTDTGTAIYRISGVAHERNRELLWRLILKELRPQPEYSQSDSFRCYRRETEIYGSGFLVRLPDGLAALPQTFCHLDAFRRNVMARKSAAGSYDSVFLDWDFSGLGAIGADIAPLAFASIIFFEVPIEQFETLEQHVPTGYLAGLADVDCRLDPGQIRLGYAAASHRFRFAGLEFASRAFLDENMHDFLPQVFGHSFAEVVGRTVAVCRLIYRLTAQVAPLLQELGHEG